MLHSAGGKLYARQFVDCPDFYSIFSVLAVSIRHIPVAIVSRNQRVIFNEISSTQATIFNEKMGWRQRLKPLWLGWS